MHLLKSLLVEHPRKARILVLLALALLALTLTACPPPESKTTGGRSAMSHPAKDQAKPPTKFHMDVKKKVVRQSGTYYQVEMTIQIRRTGPAEDGDMWIDWLPPRGCEDYTIGEVYREFWSDESLLFETKIDPDTGLSEEFTVSYDFHPAVQEGRDTLVDTFAFSSEHTSVAHDIRTYTSPQLSRAPALARTSPAVRTTAQDEDYYLWRILQLYGMNQVPMNTGLCQMTTDFLQSDSTFFALRFPVQPPSLTFTEPYTLPLVVREPYTPTLDLWDYETASSVLSFSLEYRAQYHTFLENELPAAPGEHWMALGPQITAALTCPQDLTIGADNWELAFNAWLDFGGGQHTCAGCSLPGYVCWVGREAPFFLPAMVESPGATLTSYRGWDTTCLGPIATRLGGGDLTLEGHHHAWITPTEEIWFAHGVYNNTGQPISVTLGLSSSLGLPWAIYSDTATFEPLDEPFALGSVAPENGRSFVVHTALPGDAPMGPETVLLTARGVASPTLQAWASDVVWVGDWLAPPPPPSSTYAVYLPIILR